MPTRTRAGSPWANHALPRSTRTGDSRTSVCLPRSTRAGGHLAHHAFLLHPALGLEVTERAMTWSTCPGGAIPGCSEPFSAIPCHTHLYLPGCSVVLLKIISYILGRWLTDVVGCGIIILQRIQDTIRMVKI